MFKRIQDNESASPEVKAHQAEGLWRMIAYCSDDVECRRVQVLNYFGQPIKAEECQRHCDNCADGAEKYEQDVSAQARSAIRVALELSSRPKPLSMTELVTQIHKQAHGSADGKKIPKSKIERLVNRLLTSGLLASIPYQSGYNTHARIQVCVTAL